MILPTYRGVYEASHASKASRLVYRGVYGLYLTADQSTSAASPRTDSNQATTRNNVSSVPIGEAICRPTVRPSFCTPAPTETAGCPDMLYGTANEMCPMVASGSKIGIGSSAGNAATGVTGESTRS